MPNCPPAVTPTDSDGPGGLATDHGAFDSPACVLAEQLGDGVCRFDLGTGLEDWSSGLVALLGWRATDDRPPECGLDALVHPTDWPQVQAQRHAVQAGLCTSWRTEHRLRGAQGNWVWVLDRGVVAQRDAQGQPQVLVAVFTDISAYKQMEHSLGLASERLELATRGTMDGLWDWDLGTDKVYYSPRFQVLLGHPEHPGHPGGVETGDFATEFNFRSRLHPDDRERAVAAVRAHLARKTQSFCEEYRLQTRQGDYRWFQGRGRAQWDSEGVPLRFAGQLTDITERVHSTQQQALLQVQLRDAQKLEAIANLTGGVAQDFNNLLSVMQGNLALARRELGAHPAQRPLAEVHTAVERARDLVRQMLVFARREPQRMATLDLVPVVQAALEQLRPLLPSGALLKPRLPPLETRVRVLGDAGQLQQLVLNLGTNACQALAPKAGGELVVALTPAPDGRGVTLVVQDNGVGMAEGVLARAFEPFFTTRGATGGTGMGLAVVYGLVQAHQGRIAVQSLPGQGARFEVWLPLVAHTGLLTPAPGPQWQTAEPPPRPPVVAPVAQHHVVYIDDYEAMVYLVSRLLRKRGYRVSAFERARDALALLASNPADVDLLVTDYNMPGLSGLDVVRQAKMLRADLPMVISSGHVTPAMTAEAMAEGVLQVLNKQESVEDLAQLLADLLEGLPRRSQA